MTTRITGLTSGLDVDSLVTAGASLQQSKLDKAKQQEQIYEWKQEQYREIQTSVSDFYSKYLDTTSSTSLTSSSIWNTKTFSSSSSAVTAEATSSDADVTNYTVSVSQLATAASYTLDKSEFSSSIQINGENITVTNLSSYSTNEAKGKAIASAINSNPKLSSSVTAKYSALANNGAGGVIITSNTLGKDNSGLTSVSIDGNNKTGDIAKGTNLVATITNGSNTYTISDGTSNTVTLDSVKFTFNDVTGSTSSTLTSDEVVNMITNSITSYEVSDKNGDKYTIEFSGDKVSKIYIGTGNSKTELTSDKTITISDDSIISYSNDKWSIKNKTDISGDEITTENIANIGTKITSYEVSDKNSDKYTIEISGDEVSKIYIGTGNSKTELTSGQSITLSNGNIISSDGTIIKQNSDSTAKITGNNDVSDLADRISSFITDYNTLITTINGKLYESYDSDYQPLTDDQKEDMTESQIEKWETKAQTGLLKNDSVLQKLASDMKSAMSSLLKTNNVGLDLSTIGITAVADYTTKNGTYSVDTDTLKDALSNGVTKKQSDGSTKTITFEDIKNLFTGGISDVTSLTTSIKKENKSSSGILANLKVGLNVNATMTKSTLSQKAGIVGTTSEYTNELTELLKNQATLIDQLEEKLEDKKDALYLKYSSLETSLSSLNSSSSIFSSGS